MRYAAMIEYDGLGLVGWQRQPHGPSVQSCLEEALKAFTFEDVRVMAAGRTDAGVHAVGQVVHFDLQKCWDPFRLRGALNAHLPKGQVAVMDVKSVCDTFHARFSALARSYEYRVITRRPPLVLWRHRAWQVPYGLDVGAMEKAATGLLGHHDFSTFRARECQAKSPFKTLHDVRVIKVGACVTFAFKAKSFLHHQVRNMVGSLVWVGRGVWSVEDFMAAFLKRRREAGGPMAPAKGLIFTHVDYGHHLPVPFSYDEVFF